MRFQGDQKIQIKPVFGQEEELPGLGMKGLLGTDKKGKLKEDDNEET